MSSFSFCLLEFFLLLETFFSSLSSLSLNFLSILSHLIRCHWWSHVFLVVCFVEEVQECNWYLYFFFHVASFETFVRISARSLTRVKTSCLLGPATNT